MKKLLLILPLFILFGFKPINGDIYTSLGMECSDQSPIDEHIQEGDTDFYIESV
jgi:hypothetical protein